MRRRRQLEQLAGLLLLVACVSSAGAPPTSAQTVARDGVTVTIGGRSLRCGRTPVVMDNEIPTEGMAVPGEAVYLNPFLLKRLPTTVRLFIFKHECAHGVTGPDELGADCMAAKAGAREGWLKVGDIDAVCRSFAGPATSTHPSGKTRCANIRRCYAGTQVASTNRPTGNTSKTSSWSASEADSAAAADAAVADETDPDASAE